MFPTLSRAKIPQTVAYPVTARELSEALSDIPQAGEMSLLFARGTTVIKPDSSGRRGVIRVWYGPCESSYPDWTLTIYPLPRATAGHVAELLRTEGLPHVRRWLLERRNPIWYEAPKGLSITYSQAEDRLLFAEYNAL